MIINANIWACKSLTQCSSLTPWLQCVFSLLFSAWSCSCVFLLLIKLLKARGACSCSHRLQTAGSWSSTSAAYRNTSETHQVDKLGAFSSHAWQKWVTHTQCHLTRLISSLKVLSRSIERSWGGTEWTSGPWHMRLGEAWSLPGGGVQSGTGRLHSGWSRNSAPATTCLSQALLSLPPAPLCLCLLLSSSSSSEDWRCSCCLCRTWEIILLQ